jgi:hypothetical protein
VTFSLKDVAHLEAQLAAARGRDTEPKTEQAVLAKARVAPDAMNKTEREYGERLETQKRAGSVVAYGYESWTLKLGHDLRYTPDFWVVRADGTIELHEVKGGFIRDDSSVKLKAAARAFPFLIFFLAQKKDGSWTIREVKA